MMTTDPDPMKAAPTEEILTESNNATMQSNDASASTSAYAPTFTPAIPPQLLLPFLLQL